jgi:hypothetical protein
VSARPLLAALLPHALLLSLLLAAPVQAQEAPGTVPGNAIEERSRQQVRLPGDEEREEAILSGETDIVLTRRTRLFNLHGNLDAAYTDNAFLSPAERRKDGYAQLQAGIGAGTRIGGKVDVFADASVVGVRYFENRALDYSAIAGLVGARTNLGRVQLAATYQPTVVFDRDFGRRQLTSHRFRVSASLPFRAGRVLIEPVVSGERAVTRPSDYSAWSAGGGVAVSAPLSRKVPVLAFATVNYERREFDSYFPGLVGVDRKDDALAASAGVVWRPRAWGEVRASYSYQRNWSTSDVNRYRAHGGRLGLAAVLRF